MELKIFTGMRSANNCFNSSMSENAILLAITASKGTSLFNKSWQVVKMFLVISSGE